MTNKHILSALFCVILWGFSFPLVKLICLELPPLFAMGLRLMFMSLPCVFFVEFPKKEDWLKLFILSVFSFTLTLAFTSVAITHVDATIAALITELEVPFAAILSLVFLKETMTKKQWLGILLSFLGILIITKTPEVPGNYLWAVTLLVAAAFSYGVSAIYVKKVESIGPFSVTIWTATMATPQLFIASCLFETESLHHVRGIGFNTMGALIIAAVISVVSFVIWNDLLRKYKVSQVVAFGTLIPLSSLGTSYILLAETTDFMAIIGGLVTLYGVWLQVKT